MNDRQKYNLISRISISTEYDYTHTDIEQDFYSLSDDRVWTSNVEDIDGGDNFANYCKEFFEMLNEEEYYDD